MTKNTKSFVLPLTFIGIMFFAIGFALGINSLLVPVLQKSLGISNTASYLIIAATFIPFLVFGYPAGLTIKAIGYKRTMSLSFFIFAMHSTCSSYRQIRKASPYFCWLLLSAEQPMHTYKRL